MADYVLCLLPLSVSGRFPDACAGTAPESNAAPTAALATASADDQFQKTLETAFRQLESKSLLTAAPLVELAACDGLVVDPSTLASIMGVPSLDGLTISKSQFMSLATEMKSRFGVEKVAALLGKDAFIGTGGISSAAAVRGQPSAAAGTGQPIGMGTAGGNPWNTGGQAALTPSQQMMQQQVIDQ